MKFNLDFLRSGTILLDIPFMPPCDLEETGERYVFSFDLPGISKREVKIELQDDQLIVSGKKSERKSGSARVCHLTERFHGSFRRVFTVPSNIIGREIEAFYENGVLTVNIPKSEEASITHVA